PALKRGARIVASRESPRACRTIKRAMITGLNSAGVDVADLRVLPAAVSRHLMKTHGYEAGIHVGVSQSDPEVIKIQFFEEPGIQMTSSMEKEVEKHFNRREFRRVPFGDIGNVSYPARVREGYAQDLLSELDVEAIRARGFRIVVDYGYSASSFVLPLLRLIGQADGGGRVAFPITITSRVEEIAAESGLEVVRTPAAPAELTRAASQDGVVFAGALGGVYVFPQFLPAYDAVTSLCKL